MSSRILPMRRILALVLILATSLPSQAGLVTRPTKTCGTTSYVAEVAAGCTTIKSSEVDADFNAVITGGVNNIETANINSAGLGTAAYANLSVTTGKIAVGAAAATTVRDPEPPTTGWVPAATTGSAAEITLDTTAISTRGGSILIFVSLNGMTIDDGNAITLRVKVDGALINVVTVVHPTEPSSLVIQTNMSGAVSGLATGIASGAHTISVTGQCSIASGDCNAGTGAGRTQAVELA